MLNPSLSYGQSSGATGGTSEGSVVKFTGSPITLTGNSSGSGIPPVWIVAGIIAGVWFWKRRKK
jgi:hypothetical protein